MAQQLSALTALEEAQGLTPPNHNTAHKYLWLKFQESWNPWKNSNAHKIEKNKRKWWVWPYFYQVKTEVINSCHLIHNAFLIFSF